MTHPQIIVFGENDVENVPQLEHDQTFTGNNTFAEPIILTKAIGTPPLTITSTTKVSNTTGI